VAGARSVLEKAADEGVIRVSAISAAEVIARAGDANIETTRKLLDSFDIVPVDKEVAQRAGVFYAHGRGDKLELSDCIVAAVCGQMGAVLVTRDPSKYPSDGFEVITAKY
jgi:predicted nucleic acid-binding protein